ncbi:hypothetical protein BGZ57DRAFT_860224 [Hyaloscypha finlandica]|nr:hypothetical protein BGZ57DRAFT_860224 [Hyaloscypha finlandica]
MQAAAACACCIMYAAASALVLHVQHARQGFCLPALAQATLSSAGREYGGSVRGGRGGSDRRRRGRLHTFCSVISRPFPFQVWEKVSDFSKFKEGMRDEVRLEEKEREKA